MSTNCPFRSGLPDSDGARLLRSADLHAALELQRAVLLAPASPAFRVRSADELSTMLDGSRGLAFGIELAPGAPLAAMALLRLPSRRSPNTGPPFPRVPPAHWPLDAGWLEGALVHPQARGLGHQRRLIDLRRAAAAAVGLRWLCAAALLANVASWRNLLQRGFAVVGLREGAEVGAPGRVLGLLAPGDGGPLATGSEGPLRVALDDADRLRQLLDAGHAGVALEGGALQLVRLQADDAVPAARAGA